MRFVLFVSLLILSYPLQAQPKIQVVLLGVYHPNNPGQDVAKVRVDDILGEKPDGYRRLIYTVLDGQIIRRLTSLQAYVKNYKPF